MNKIWLLTKLQLKGILNPKKMFYMKEEKKTSKIVLILLALLLVLIFGGVSGVYAYLYATMLKPLDALEAIPAMWMAITCILTLFTTIYKVKGTLFQFSDYDMVMSLPVSTSGIVASRIAVLYLYDLVFSLIILLPGNIVYGIYANAGVGFYLISTILTFFVPLIPILLGTILGLVVTMASSRFRHSNLLTIVLFVGLFCAYMIFMMQTATAPNPEVVFTELANILMTQVYGVYPLTRMYVQGVTELNWMSILGFVIISVVIFLAFCLITGKAFKKINTMVASMKAKSNYKMRELKTNGIVKSLYKKELKRYFACPMYVLNSAVGMLLLTIAIIMLVVSGKEKLGELFAIPGLADNVGSYVPILLLFGVCMTCTTAASISLEGKSLWILKSLPITPSQIFVSKAMVNLTVTLPMILLDTLIFAVYLKMTLLQIVTAIVLPCSGAAFISFFGLLLNMKFPRFDWKSEMEVVKQGLPTLLALLIGMVIGMLPIGGLVLIPQLPVSYLYLAFTLILTIITVGIYQYLVTKASIAFERL